MIWIPILIYVIGAVFNGFVGIMIFTTAYTPKDKKYGAEVILATPVWPLYWGKKLIKVIAQAVTTLREEEKK